MFRKNTAGQFICVQMILTATGAVGTGLTPAARRCLDGTFAAGGGTYTEDGTTGSYKYAMSQGDTNANNVSIITTATGCIPVCVNFVTTAADPTDSVRFGLTALPNAAAEAAGGLYTRGSGAGQIAQQANGQADVNLSTIKTQTVTCAAGVTVLASVGTAATSTAQTGDNFARLGAPAGASVSADVAAVKVDTAAVKVQTDKMTFTVANVIDANALRINGDATAAADLAQSADTIIRGTCSGGTTTTAVVSALVNPSSLTDAGQLIGRTIIFKGSTGTANVQGQASNITGSTTGATPTITFTAMTTAPANGDTFVVV